MPDSEVPTSGRAAELLAPRPSMSIFRPSKLRETRVLPSPLDDSSVWEVQVHQ